MLEAIIRGCPVISYGFGYGHVRVSNHALERFRLAQVARSRSGAAARRSSARWPSTRAGHDVREAAIDRGADPRQHAPVQPLPAWRVRAVRTVTRGDGLGGLRAAAHSRPSVAYAVVSFFGPGTAPRTSVPTV